MPATLLSEKLPEMPIAHANGVPTLSASERRAGYQRLMLGQMGITPWASRTQSSQCFEVADIFTQTYAAQAVVADPIVVPQPQSFNQPVSISPNANIATGNLDNRDNFEQNFRLSNVQTGNLQDNQLPNASSKTNHLKNSNATSHELVNNPAALALPIRLHLQAITIQDWIVIADMAWLQSPTALQLWQSICQNLCATVHEFRYPLRVTRGYEYIGQHFSQQPLMAQASFAGFICAVQRGNCVHSHVTSCDNAASMAGEMAMMQNMSGANWTAIGSEQQKIGAITPLPDMLEDERLTRLPYLAEMLEDYRQKRQFWQLMIANTANYIT